MKLTVFMRRYGQLKIFYLVRFGAKIRNLLAKEPTQQFLLQFSGTLAKKHWIGSKIFSEMQIWDDILNVHMWRRSVDARRQKTKT